ncbi:hypothetical protein OH799_05765 [Nocardia sp. NBC_00881]|uniref:MmyB family transcriptional regulator n=1 Tax=Nocardia sp. NBC_00881 TaxID=2975995 RepID=UPI00386CA756|nr:hypothetical protein OH799_05765 [Nocardia sp. NBC_00881]
MFVERPGSGAEQLAAEPCAVATLVRFHRIGTKRIHHPDVGNLEFVYQVLEFPDACCWALYGLTAEPGSPTEERIRLLGTPRSGAQIAPRTCLPAARASVLVGRESFGRGKVGLPTEPQTGGATVELLFGHREGHHATRIVGAMIARRVCAARSRASSAPWAQAGAGRSSQ